MEHFKLPQGAVKIAETSEQAFGPEEFDTYLVQMKDGLFKYEVCDFEGSVDEFVLCTRIRIKVGAQNQNELVYHAFKPLTRAQAEAWMDQAYVDVL